VARKKPVVERPPHVVGREVDFEHGIIRLTLSCGHELTVGLSSQPIVQLLDETFVVPELREQWIVADLGDEVSCSTCHPSLTPPARL